MGLNCSRPGTRFGSVGFARWLFAASLLATGFDAPGQAEKPAIDSRVIGASAPPAERPPLIVIGHRK